MPRDLAGGFSVFWVYAFPYLPFQPEQPWGIAAYHKINAFLIIGCCLTVFYKAMFTDPGMITLDNVQDELLRFEFDRIIYCSKSCSTCTTPRPARSKHCSICKCCVARFDHHCPWINNCVGANNVAYFLTFLLAHSGLCLYGGVLLAHILIAIVAEERLLDMYIRDDSGRLAPITYPVLHTCIQLPLHFIALSYVWCVYVYIYITYPAILRGMTLSLSLIVSQLSHILSLTLFVYMYAFE